MNKDRENVIRCMIVSNLRLATALLIKGHTIEAKDYLDSARNALYDINTEKDHSTCIPKEALDALLKKAA